MILSLDLLGIGSRNWDLHRTIEAVRSYPGDLGIGAFDAGWPHAFGDPRGNLAKLIAACPNVKLIRIQGYWSTKHELVPQEITAARVPLWQKFAEAHPQVKVYYSPSCEYSSNDVGAIRKRIAAVHTLGPLLTSVCCPMGGSASLAGEISEEHGSRASCGPNQIASWDGQACWDYDCESWMRRNSGAIACFMWTDICNMAESHNVLTPDQRIASPSVGELKQMLRSAQPSGTPPAPTFTGHVTTITKPLLYKVAAENMRGPNSRDDKPLLIASAAAPHADVITYDGQKLGTFPIFGRPGEYPGNLTRFYSGLPGGMSMYGYEIAALCKEKSGTEWGFFRIGNHYFGPVHFAFRRGFWQP